MEARDTVMTHEQIAKVAYKRNEAYIGSSLEFTRKPDADIAIAQAQADVSFKAGKQEMVRFIKEIGYAQKRYYGNLNGSEDYFEIQFPWEKWQAQLKECGMSG